MYVSNLTPRQYYEQIKANPTRGKFGFGAKPALVNIDLQAAYTSVGEFRTAYETDPKQMEYVNELAQLCRSRGFPVIWTFVAYLESGEDAGVWGLRDDTPDSLQHIKPGSRRAQFDDRLNMDPKRDVIMQKRMASPFHETHLQSLLVWHKVDTVIVTGGSTSGCVRACAVDSLSRGYRTIVPEECVADVHDVPHYASLIDMQLKYADVEAFATVRDRLAAYPPVAAASA
jgi:maleamate amidohydrolase